MAYFDFERALSKSLCGISKHGVSGIPEVQDTTLLKGI
jgi:hypothetical protein